MTSLRATKLAASSVFMAALVLHQAAAQQAPPPKVTLKQLLRVAGLTVAPSQLRGPEDAIEPGDIWVADTSAHSAAALTTDGGYLSPTFAADGSIYALKGQAIVHLVAAAAHPAVIQTIASPIKLVGFSADDPDALIVLRETAHGESPLEMVSLKSGKVTELPYQSESNDDRQMLAQVRGQDRIYGNTALYTKTQSKQGMSRTIEWRDVYLKTGGGLPQDISNCDGNDCGQPALSPDGRKVAYVKSTS
jgi:hypothetical protein